MPDSLAFDDVARVHDAEYVRAVQTGEPRSISESQGLSWDSELWEMVLASNGGVVAAVRDIPIAFVLTGGYVSASCASDLSIHVTSIADANNCDHENPITNLIQDSKVALAETVFVLDARPGEL